MVYDIVQAFAQAARTVSSWCEGRIQRAAFQPVVEFERGEVDVPDYYITMGPRAIMAARELVMIASGEKKAKAVAKLLSGEVTEEWPSTVLTLHPHFTLIADEAALSEVA